jgi:hypothetical protein
VGQAKSVADSEVTSFQGAICTENSSLGPDEVSLYYKVSSFCRVAIHRFDCSLTAMEDSLWRLCGMLMLKSCQGTMGARLSAL